LHARRRFRTLHFEQRQHDHLSSPRHAAGRRIAGRVLILSMQSSSPYMTMTSLLRSLGCLVILAGLSLAGCSHQPRLYDVSGSVTFDGQPIPEGDLLFITPDGTRGPDPAKITDGKYELKATA